MPWIVTYKRKQERSLQKLPREVQALFQALVKDLETTGPEQIYNSVNVIGSKLGGNKYHCHLNYSYVACWINNNGTLTIEVYYVGSRENAPY